MRLIVTSAILAALMCSVPHGFAAEKDLGKIMVACVERHKSDVRSDKPEEGKKKIRDCIEKNGISMEGVPTNAKEVEIQAHQMGLGADDSAGKLREMIYGDEDEDADEDEGVEATARQRQDQDTSPGYADMEGNVEEQNPEHEHEPARPKYYLPSDKSGEKTKPVFLPR